MCRFRNLSFLVSPICFLDLAQNGPLNLFLTTLRIIEIQNVCNGREILLRSPLHVGISKMHLPYLIIAAM